VTMTQNGRIEWADETRKLADLIPWERNPREITHAQAERLVDSVESFGQVEPLAIGPNDELYNGHQRLKVLAEEYGPDYTVAVRVASRALSEKEREKLTIYLHKGASGSWDFDVLANEFEVDELLEWGFEPFDLGGAGELPGEFPEYDESVADEVEWHECPECGHKWPK
jgi:hypothetical protein